MPLKLCHYFITQIYCDKEDSQSQWRRKEESVFLEPSLAVPTLLDAIMKDQEAPSLSAPHTHPLCS